MAEQKKLTAEQKSMARAMFGDKFLEWLEQEDAARKDAATAPEITFIPGAKRVKPEPIRFERVNGQIVLKGLPTGTQEGQKAAKPTKPGSSMATAFFPEKNPGPGLQAALDRIGQGRQRR